MEPARVSFFPVSPDCARVFHSCPSVTVILADAVVGPAIAGSVILTSGTFGYLSFRSFMGRDATRAVLGSRPPLSWPFWALFSVPLLPYVQILSAISSDILSAERFHM
jgi:hypothetical protein